jgi:site-specific DNA recombinase
MSASAEPLIRRFIMRAAAYARVSDPSDPRTASLDSQLQGIKARLKGYQIDEYVERQSGAEFDARPELTKLREKLKLGIYQKLGVYALDRLSRDIVHLCTIWYECQRSRCELFSSTETLEDTAEGRLLVAVRGFVAQTEREKIKERTQRGLRRLLEEGKIPGAGVAKFGYVYDKQTRQREIHPEAAPIVQRIFQLAAQARTIRQIMNLFNNEGIPSANTFAKRAPAIRGWGKEVIRSILRDPSYYGERLQWAGQPVGSGTPPLVSRSLWDRAQKTIDRGKTYSGSLTDQRKFWVLAGMIFCKCGARMYHGKGPGDYCYYICGRKRVSPSACRNQNMPVFAVEKAVWSKLVNIINNPTVMREAIERAQGRASDLLSELDSHRQAIGKRQAAIERLVELLGSNESPDVQRSLGRKLRSLTDEIEGHRRELTALENQLAERGLAAGGLQEVLAGCQAGCSVFSRRRWPRTTSERLPCPSCGLPARSASRPRTTRKCHGKRNEPCSSASEPAWCWPIARCNYRLIFP